MALITGIAVAGSSLEEIQELNASVDQVVFDSFRPGECFTTKEAVDICRAEIDDFREHVPDYCWTFVLGRLYKLVELHLLQKAPTGWRLDH